MWSSKPAGTRSALGPSTPLGPADLPPTVVIIPTYNEIANLARIAVEVLGLSPSISLVIVDDASPDGTGREADRLAASLRRVTVMHRRGKLGLGSAYRQAFKAVLQSTDAELICQMDADFSHRPADLMKILNEARNGAGDVVVGARYVRGACVQNWSRRRKLLSRAGNLYARWITGMPQSDLTGGMKCWRRKVLEAIDLDAVTTEGYGFQIGMCWQVWRSGFAVYEVPITFVERAHGASKMSWSIVCEAILLPWTLRFGG
ncbi:MAG: polyprenol monophosphomannose synthase [Nitrospirae bacterium]|nr:MAG: polyprenol monophosphomannose synthase [Nitrospirota bacterium]